MTRPLWNSASKRRAAAILVGLIALAAAGYWARERSYPFTPGLRTPWAGLRAGRAVFRDALAARARIPLSASVVINEVCAGGSPPFYDESRLARDWVELYNRTDREVSLEGYSLSDSRLNPRRWVFPDAPIPPHGYQVVWLSGPLDKRARELTRHSLHADFKLAREGETIALFDPLGFVVDYVAVPALEPGQSFSRRAPGEGVFQVGSPTPLGRPIASAVSVQPASGAYAEAVTVSLAAPEPADVIRFTLDGSDPGPESPRYDGPVVCDTNALVKARVFRDGSWPGPITHRFYWREALPPTPLISLAVDPSDLYSPEIGIVRNFMEDGWFWERPGWITYLDAGGVCFEGPVGVRIQGMTTRYKRNKSFKVFFRDIHGMGEADYDPWDPGSGFPLRKLIIKSFALYNHMDLWSKGTYDALFIAGPLGYDVARACGVEAPDTRYAVLFLNGQPYGASTLVEEPDEIFLTRRFGHPRFDLIKYQAHEQAMVGSLSLFKKFKLQVRSILKAGGGDGTTLAGELATRIDMESLIRWLAISGFIRVRDFNQGLFAREQDLPAATWRVMFWDTDNAFVAPWRTPKQTWEIDHLNNIQRSWKADLRAQIFRDLLKDPDFTGRLAQVIQRQLNNCLRADRWIAEIDRREQLLMQLLPYERRGEDTRGGRTAGSDLYEQYLRSACDYMRLFFRETHAAYPAQAAALLQAGPPRALALDLEGEGEVRIDGNAEGGGFRGVYFEGSLLDLEARPRPGHRFRRWELNGETRTEARVRLVIWEDMAVKAIFEHGNGAAS